MEAELAAELAVRERERARLAARTVLDQLEAEHGPVPPDEVARVRQERLGTEPR